MDNEIQTLQAHGAYIPPPSSHADVSNTEGLAHVEYMLSMTGVYVLVGDFNLHHPRWGGPTYPYQHAQTEELLLYTSTAGLELITPKEIITRDTHGEQTTIDLSFISSQLTGRVIECRLVPELENSSDHLSITVSLMLNTPAAHASRPRRNWKVTDERKLERVLLQRLPPPLTREKHTREAINEYANTLLTAIELAVDESTPWAESCPRSKAYWSKECSGAVKYARRLRRIYTRTHIREDWEKY